MVHLQFCCFAFCTEIFNLKMPLILTLLALILIILTLKQLYPSWDQLPPGLILDPPEQTCLHKAGVTREGQIHAAARTCATK